MSFSRRKHHRGSTGEENRDPKRETPGGWQTDLAYASFGSQASEAGKITARQELNEAEHNKRGDHEERYPKLRHESRDRGRDGREKSCRTATRENTSTNRDQGASSKKGTLVTALETMPNYTSRSESRKETLLSQIGGPRVGSVNSIMHPSTMLDGSPIPRVPEETRGKTYLSIKAWAAHSRETVEKRIEFNDTLQGPVKGDFVEWSDSILQEEAHDVFAKEPDWIYRIAMRLVLAWPAESNFTVTMERQGCYCIDKHARLHKGYRVVAHRVASPIRDTKAEALLALCNYLSGSKREDR